MVKRLEDGTIEAWEVFASAMGPIPGNRRPHWAKKPQCKKDTCDAQRTRRARKNQARRGASNSALLMREFESTCPLDVIVPVEKLVQDQTIPTDNEDVVLSYFQDAIRRFEHAGATPSLRAMDAYVMLKHQLEKGEVESWQVLRAAVNKCWRKACGYPSWARKPKAQLQVDAEGPETQPVDAEDTDDDDEFADAFQDATSVPFNPVDDTEPSVRDEEAQNDAHTERTFALEKCETCTPPEDEMTTEQMKDRLEFYRVGARRAPQHYLQKFINLNNKICNAYEASQRKIRETAKKAMEELRRDASPSPERVPKRRERVNIIGYIEKLEGLERQEGPEHKKAAAHGLEQKSKRQRVRKTPDAEPKTVEEAILKHLREPISADVDKKECADDDIFDELFGGPSDEVDGGLFDNPEPDLLEQLEIDLTEL